MGIQRYMWAINKYFQDHIAKDIVNTNPTSSNSKFRRLFTPYNKYYTNTSQDAFSRKDKFVK